MAQDRVDPGDQVPEADLLEQQSPIDEPLIDAERSEIIPEPATDDVDEADRWEQQAPLLAEDDYPHQRDPAGWS